MLARKNLVRNRCGNSFAAQVMPSKRCQGVYGESNGLTSVDTRQTASCHADAHAAASFSCVPTTVPLRRIGQRGQALGALGRATLRVRVCFWIIGRDRVRFAEHARGALFLVELHAPAPLRKLALHLARLL